MSKSILVLLVGFFLTACMATHPERLKVRHPEDPNIYSGLSCEAIDAKLAVLYPRLDETYSNLRYKAELDLFQAVTIPFFPPMALTLESGDGPDAAHFRTMRGQESFLHQEWRKKDCLAVLARVPTAEELYEQALEKANKPKTGG